MEALIALALSVVFAYACADALKKNPIPFYVAFAVVGIVYASGLLGQFASGIELALLPFLRRASLAFGLFTVVMFVGVLPQSSALRMRLAPVRGPLALLGVILVAVHVLGYAANYLAALAAGTASTWIVAGLLFGLAVAVLLAILAITSVKRVHSSMDPVSWKRVQKLAYPFYLLMFVHLAAMLLPSSLMGGNSMLNLAIYTVVVIAYVVLRLARASRER